MQPSLPYPYLGNSFPFVYISLQRRFTKLYLVLLSHLTSQTNNGGRPFIVPLLNGDTMLNINLHYCDILWQMIRSSFFFPFPSSATLYGYSSRCEIIVGLRARKYQLGSILGAPQMDRHAGPTQRQVWGRSNWQSPDAELWNLLPEDSHVLGRSDSICVSRLCHNSSQQRLWFNPAVVWNLSHWRIWRNMFYPH